MEPPTSTLVCPVCFLFLREGISLKSHLQTHSKDKVIEALLNKQTSIENDTNLETDAPTSVIQDAASDNRESSFNRNTSSILPTPFIPPTSGQVNATPPTLNCNQAVTAVNNFQYMPTVNNNLITQAVAGNSFNPNVTYQPYITSDGNIMLVPTYMSNSPFMVSNNLLNPPVINPCVVVPPSTGNIGSVAVIDSDIPQEEQEEPKSPECTDLAQDSNIQEPTTSASDLLVGDIESEVPKTSIDEFDKENDAEVASIFQTPARTNDGMEVGNGPQNAESSNLLDVDDDKLSCGSYDNLDASDHEHYSESSPFANNYVNDESRKSVISPDLSVIRVRNDLNFENGNSNFHTERARTPYHETSNKIRFDTESAPRENSQMAQHYGECSKSLVGGVNVAPTRNTVSVSSDRNEQFDFIVSNSDNATHILPDNLDESVNAAKAEKEHYILPNNEIPRTSPVNSDYNFIGLRSSFLTSASLISSVNKTMFADVDVYAVEKNEQNYFDKYEGTATNTGKDDRHLTSQLEPVSITEVNVGKRQANYGENDVVDSAGSSRISPFNIQTDESMPARGELSGQESLSGTENSVWELQVKQSSFVARCSVPCKKENTDVKIGLQSLMSEINIKMDADTFRNAETMADEDSKVVVQKFIKKKLFREFRCFHCKETFASWKSRQLHIANSHAEEDGLTIESLFSKKIKCKQEEDDDIDLTAENLICRICDGTFDNSAIFLEHLKTMHGIKKRNCVCPTCLVPFSNPEEYQEHIQKVHPYECMTCGKKFHTRPGYMLHQKRHMKVKPYGCDVCDKSFVTKQKLTEHMNIHTGDNPIKCDMCDSTFKRYSNYQQHKKYLHMNTKRKLKDFICECGEVFHSKTKLIWHREIHDEKPKQCPFCVERFVHTASLTRHVRKWHNDTYLSDLVDKKKIKNVTCPICNVTYLHTSLQTHMRIHEGIKPFSCGECSKTFRTKWNLQLHRWTHMSRSAKPFKCKLCVKAYIHKTDYEAHLRSHSNCRPYSCNVCGRQFIRKYNCIRHMREHKEPRTFKCNICKKMFSRSYYLTEHRKTHTGEKPHTCHVCGKSSATKSNHNKHVKMHNNIRESVNTEG